MQLSSRHETRPEKCAHKNRTHVRGRVWEEGAYKRLLEREKDISINILAKVNIKKRNGNVGIMQA